jgi:hypothetical protein
VYIFTTTDSHNLTFDPSLSSVTADIFVVADGGSGGSSSSTDKGGGGGAGGLWYETGRSLSVNDGAIAVTVGAGGREPAGQARMATPPL